MARTFTTRFAVALAALLSFGLSAARAQFSIIQDSVVTADASGTIRQYNATTGVVTGTRTTTDLGALTGLTVLGNRVFVANTNGNVYEVDPAGSGTGSLIITGAGVGLEGLGDNGTNLLTYNFSSGQVREYTASGSLVQTITVANQGAGIDGSGSRIFVSELDTGSAIREYNQSGTNVNTINTLLPTGSITGLGYDPFGDTYWVATGGANGDDLIREFSPSGTVVNSFPAFSGDVAGLDFVPVPEPGSCLAVAAAVLGLGAVARRRLRRSAATA